MNIMNGIILVCLTISVVTSKKIQPRVLSFKLSPDAMYPFEATVLITRKFACTAIMITRSQFLTVAQCVAHVVSTSTSQEKPPRVKVRLGSIGKNHGTTYRAQRISHHPDFSQLDPDIYIHDIAVIHVLPSIILSNQVVPVQLPLPHSDVLPKVLLLFSGLAGERGDQRTLSTLLMRIITNAETMQECQGYFKSFTLIKQVCIQINPEFRYGPVDPGGPMLDTDETTIFGLASSGCIRNGTKGIPKIFTKVSEYIPYILEEINYGTPNYTTKNPPPFVNIDWNPHT